MTGWRGLSLDLGAEIWHVLNEILVDVATFMRSMVYSLKAIDVTLSLERLVFGLIEVPTVLGLGRKRNGNVRG